METITANLYEYRSKTVVNAVDLKESAEMHREIYRAIRSHNPAQARVTMEQHLNLARIAQASEAESAATAQGSATESASAQTPPSEPNPIQ
jgi:GntR family transcriptional repressor for pyruvate dehydrogenase complex